MIYQFSSISWIVLNHRIINSTNICSLWNENINLLVRIKLLNLFLYNLKNKTSIVRTVVITIYMYWLLQVINEFMYPWKYIFALNKKKVVSTNFPWIHSVWSKIIDPVNFDTSIFKFLYMKNFILECFFCQYLFSVKNNYTRP